MACEKGQAIQDDFDKTVESRMAIEGSGEGKPAIAAAKTKEAAALMMRAIHVRECVECFQRPPRTKRVFAMRA